MAGLIATKKYPGRGVRHLWRMAVRQEQFSNTRVTCLLAILEHKKLEYSEEVIDIYRILNSSERLQVLKHVKLNKNPLAVYLVKNIDDFENQHRGNNTADQELVNVLNTLKAEIANIKNISIQSADRITNDDKETVYQVYDPFEIGVNLPIDNEYISILLHDDVAFEKLFRIHKVNEPISKRNPLILMKGEIHLKYDGKVLERSKIEWVDMKHAAINSVDPVDIYINPRKYDGVFERGSLTKDFILKNPGHFSLFIRDIVDDSDEERIIKTFLNADPALEPVAEWIRISRNLLERSLELYSQQDFGVLDEWFYYLNLFITDDLIVRLRLSQLYYDELYLIQSEENMKSDFGSLLPDGSVRMGSVSRINDMDRFREGVIQLIQKHTEIDVDEAFWSKIDTSQVEEIMKLVAG